MRQHWLTAVVIWRAEVGAPHGSGSIKGRGWALFGQCLLVSCQGWGHDLPTTLRPRRTPCTAWRPPICGITEHALGHSTHLKVLKDFFTKFFIIASVCRQGPLYKIAWLPMASDTYIWRPELLCGVFFFCGTTCINSEIWLPKKRSWLSFWRLHGSATTVASDW